MILIYPLLILIFVLLLVAKWLGAAISWWVIDAVFILMILPLMWFLLAWWRYNRQHKKPRK